jgi:cyclopropane-fatty-acyl-phospholipid synthase
MKAKLEEIFAEMDIQINGSRPQDIQVHDPRFYTALAKNPSLGAGESYMNGWWDCDSLDQFFFQVTRGNIEKKIFKKYQQLLLQLFNAVINFQTRKKSKKVAEEHYNIDNELYSHMLGQSMAYTCAYWHGAKTLDEAQFNKFDLICRKLNLQPGEQVLDLGCGFGGLAKYAAEHYGCSVVGVNIATEQLKFAKANSDSLPLTFVNSDYRDIDRYNPKRIRFDKVVSIGLFEHIGPKNHQDFIQIARHQLKEEGLFLLHAVVDNYSRNYPDPWIDKYIFPGARSGSMQEMCKAYEGHFIVEDVHNIGADYDPTLMAWHENINAHWHDLSKQRDERFKRMWNYYLLSCAGISRSRHHQLVQWVLSPKGIVGGYQTIR